MDLDKLARLYGPLSQMLIGHEGLRLKPYRDTVGKLTIGVGRNLDDVGISKQEALALLVNDIAKATDQASAFSFWKTINPARQDVVISMIFNMGMKGFMKFQKLIHCLEAQDFDGAAREMLNSKWALQVGERAKDLALMMAEGFYPTSSSEP